MLAEQAYHAYLFYSMAFYFLAGAGIWISADWFFMDGGFDCAGAG